MAHYALLDKSRVVVSVITGLDETDVTHDWEQFYGEFHGKSCKRTSYNTQGGVHALGGTPFRKNYAGIGYTYDAQRDAFVPPRPFASWLLNDDTCLWDAPVTMPTDDKQYQWDEVAGAWVEAQE